MVEWATNGEEENKGLKGGRSEEEQQRTPALMGLEGEGVNEGLKYGGWRGGTNRGECGCGSLVGFSILRQKQYFCVYL